MYFYCAECGARTLVDSTTIKYCSSCGEPFIKVSQANQVKPTQTQPSQPPLPKPKPKPLFKKKQIAQVIEDQEDIEDEIENEIENEGDEENDDYVEIPEITENPFIVEEEKPRKITIGNLIGTASKNASNEKIDRPKPKKLSKKQFQEQWQKEAGTLRPK